MNNLQHYCLQTMTTFECSWSVVFQQQLRGGRLSDGLRIDQMGWGETTSRLYTLRMLYSVFIIKMI